MMVENNIITEQPVKQRFLIERAIAKIDLLVSNQLELIINHPALKNLESSWYSLYYLVIEQEEAQKNIKIKILNISKNLLLKDLNYTSDYENTILFNLTYNEEFGMPGGEPFAVLIGDYDFSANSKDIHALSVLSQIAAASFAPFIASAAPALLGIDHFAELGKPYNFSNIFQQVEYGAWTQLRVSEDARFIGLTVPKRLLRNPYRDVKHTVSGFCFIPRLSNKNSYLWGNAAYAFATVLLRAFSDYGWLGQICGFDEKHQGGYVPNITEDYFYSDTSFLMPKFSTDVYITDQQEQELSGLGFIPLCQRYASNKAIFYSNNSIQSFHLTEDSVAEKNMSLSAQLQYLLCACRFAHYIKVLGRDKVGSFIDIQACQSYLNNWLMNYVAGNSELSPSQSARYPLRAARVEIKDNPSKENGNYLCIIYLKPHFQLEQVMAPLKFVTELSAK